MEWVFNYMVYDNPENSLQNTVRLTGNSYPCGGATDGRGVEGVQVVLRPATGPHKVGGVLLAARRPHHLPSETEVRNTASRR